MVSTHLKNIRQIGSSPQVGAEIKKYLSCHHLAIYPIDIQGFSRDLRFEPIWMTGCFFRDISPPSSAKSTKSTEPNLEFWPVSCWCFRNAANQLRLVVYASHDWRCFIYIPGGAGFLPSTVWVPNQIARKTRHPDNTFTSWNLKVIVATTCFCFLFVSLRCGILTGVHLFDKIQWS